MESKDYYHNRIITAEQAAAKIENGDQIMLGHGVGMPIVFPDALAKRHDELKNVRIYHGVAYGPAPYCAEHIDPTNLSCRTLFESVNTRKACAEGRGDFFPCHFSAMPANIRSGRVPINVAIVHITPPDRHGFCSFGISVDYQRAAVEVARLVIAEVNPNMPRTFGDTLIHVSEVDYFVESDNPLYTIGMPVIGDVEEKIGQHIALLVDDGSCLQVGIGSIPEAVMRLLKDKNDLGIHTELLSDGIMELMKKGVINNKRKTLHAGKTIATFAGGSREFYDWLHENPSVEFYSVDYVNYAHIISLNDNMVSINSALEVDLQGRVNAEAIGVFQYSGVGGQVDFIRGATWAKGGKSIIALPSTAKNGTISRISAVFSPGTPETTSRNDVDYIVTEFGVAHLRGKTLGDRARRLIAISAPKFREELKEKYEFIYGIKL